MGIGWVGRGVIFCRCTATWVAKICTFRPVKAFNRCLKGGFGLARQMLIGWYVNLDAVFKEFS